MKKVYLSPSNQEHNVGVGDYGSEETRMIEISNIVKTELENNFNVKQGEKNESIEERVNEANAWGANAYISIHSNAGGGRGCEVFAYSSVAPGEKLARKIYEKLEKITPSSDRGVKFDSNFYELNSTIAPACLVEIAFHDNIDDANWIINNKELIGKEIARGIYEFFNIEYGNKEKNKISKIQNTLNERYGYNLVIDGIYGTKTKTALIKALQHELNVQFGRNLMEDRNIWTKNKRSMCSSC